MPRCQILFFALVPLRAHLIYKNKPGALIRVIKLRAIVPSSPSGLQIPARHNYLYGIIVDNVKRI
jgi:hypothetical protein